MNVIIIISRVEWSQKMWEEQECSNKNNSSAIYAFNKLLLRKEQEVEAATWTLVDGQRSNLQGQQPSYYTMSRMAAPETVAVSGA